MSSESQLVDMLAANHIYTLEMEQEQRELTVSSGEIIFMQSMGLSVRVTPLVMCNACALYEHNGCGYITTGSISVNVCGFSFCRGEKNG